MRSAEHACGGCIVQFGVRNGGEAPGIRHQEMERNAEAGARVKAQSPFALAKARAAEVTSIATAPSPAMQINYRRRP